jgi:hypothetical protein
LRTAEKNLAHMGRVPLAHQKLKDLSSKNKVKLKIKN